MSTILVKQGTSYQQMRVRKGQMKFIKGAKLYKNSKNLPNFVKQDAIYSQNKTWKNTYFEEHLRTAAFFYRTPPLVASENI